jgi:hypothetical protein
MFFVMLPRNPLLENFGQLLEVFKTSLCIHQLIEHNMVADANFFSCLGAEVALKAEL